MKFPERGAGPVERVHFIDVAAACKKEPGEWFKVRSATTEHSASSLRAKIKSGVRAAFRPAGDFDAYAKKTADAAWDIFASYRPAAPTMSEEQQPTSTRKRSRRRRPPASVRRASAARTTTEQAEKDGT